MSLEGNTTRRFEVLILLLCPIFFEGFNFVLNISYGALQYRDRVMSSVWRTEAFVTKTGTNNEDI
jgi:hypothetical protein